MPDDARTIENNQSAMQGDDATEPSMEAEGRVAELRVSAHLMKLDTGVFCVFPVPGSPLPDPATGLPGVRVSQAPGHAGRSEAVKISTFREDGWLDGTAALVRVADGPANILVTIYQSARQLADAAPRLQVMRLSGDAAAPAPAGVSAAPVVAVGPDPEAVAHVQRTGDIGGQFGDWIGVKGSRLWIEGFGLSPHQKISEADIEYQAVLGRGWLSPWVEGGKYCGSRGMALPLLGIKVRLKGDAAKMFDCSYSATFVDGSATGPVPAGESCEAESLSALEAFQIELHAKGAGPALNRPAVDRSGLAGKAPARAQKPKAPARITRR
jgi:hypothetical protein